MDDQPEKIFPFWINRLLALAAFLACTAALFAAISGWEQRPHHHAEMVADITVNLKGRPMREHCTTCHPGGSAAISRDKKTVAGHPDITPHSVEKLGCTGCHLGEGMALDAAISHGLPGLGARNVLRGKDLQASCYTCHELKPLKGAASAWEGFDLYLAKACDTCHNVAAMGKGGRYGPDLSAIGSYLGLEKIYEAIRDPKKEPENSIMPRFPLSREQAQNISHFLKSRVKDPFYITPMLIQAGKVPVLPGELAKGLPLSGEGLLETKKCLGCHKFRAKDGGIAPDHTFIGRIRSPEYLRHFISSPARVIPGAIMPIIPMSEEEKELLVTFLGTEATTSLNHSDPKHLYMTLCQRCHAAAGDGFGLIQPNLSTFPRAFSNNAEFFRQIGDERIVKSLEQGIPGTSMPAYGGLLSTYHRESLLNLIFSAFIRIGRNDKASLPPLPPKPLRSFPTEKTGSLFQRECSRCHGIAGTGTGPEALKHLPRPRNLTSHPYFAAVDDNRIARTILDGIPGTAMPSYREKLAPTEIWSMVGKVRQFSRSGDGKTTAHESPGMAP